MSEYQSQVTIEEVGGARKVVLGGPSLPLQGVDWGGENKLVTTWYPGNADEGTQQTLGPKESPTKMSGDWRRTMMGASPAEVTDSSGATSKVRNPAELRDALEEILRGGRRLRVTWSVSSNDLLGSDDKNGKIVREGRAHTWKFKHTRHQDIEWEVDWEWVSRGKAVKRVAALRAPSLAVTGIGFVNSIQGIISANALAQLQKGLPHHLTLGQLENIANLPTKLVTGVARQIQQVSHKVSAIVGIARTLASQPLQVANAAVNQANNTVSLLNNSFNALANVPRELQTNRMHVRDFNRAATHFSRLDDMAQRAAIAGHEFATAMRPPLAQVALTGEIAPHRASGPGSFQRAYVVKPGDTPQKVSQRFFDTPDHAVDILKANRLSWYAASLTPGRVLIIPAVNAGAGPSGGP